MVNNMRPGGNGVSGCANQSALTRFVPIRASVGVNDANRGSSSVNYSVPYQSVRNIPALPPSQLPPQEEEQQIPTYPQANVGIKVFNYFGAWLTGYISECYSMYLREQNLAANLQMEKKNVEMEPLSVQKEKQEEAEKFKSEAMKLKQELNFVKGQLEDKEKVSVAQEIELANLRAENSEKAKRIKELEDDQQNFNRTIQRANGKVKELRHRLARREDQVAKIRAERDSLQSANEEFERKTSGQLTLLSADKDVLEKKNSILTKEVEKERKLTESSNSAHKQFKNDIIQAALPPHLADLVIKSMGMPEESGLQELMAALSPPLSPTESPKPKKRSAGSSSTSAEGRHAGKLGRMETVSGNGPPYKNPSVVLERISHNGTSKETMDLCIKCT